MSWLDEEDIELNALDEFADIGWGTAFGPDISKGCADASKRERDEFDHIILQDRLRSALTRPTDVDQALLDDALLELRKVESQNLMSENLRVHRLLTEGCPLSYRDDTGQERGVRVRYIDFTNQNNDFSSTSLPSSGQTQRRMDIIAFINGIPVSVLN